MQQKKKYIIFRDIKKSITKIENYEDFAVDKLKDTVLYTIKFICICSFIISLISTIICIYAMKDISNEIKQIIDSVRYENGILSINEDNPTQINYSDFFNIIIDTSSDNENKKELDYIDNFNKRGNCIIILKQKYIIQNFLSKELKQYNYKDLQDNGVEIKKEYILSMFEGINFYFICLTIFIILFIIIFVIYGLNFIFNALLFSVIGKVISVILKVPIKIKATYNIATHSLTLPVLLQVLYISINIAITFDIKYFQIMYIGITYIYIITAILMIKTDFIKRKIELNKILEEQEKIKKEKQLEEINNKLQDEKNQKEEGE